MDILSSVYAHAVVLSALAVVALHQILKLNLVPLSFANRYPVPTLLVLSVLASIAVDLKGLIVPHSWTDWIILAATIAVTAGLSYRATLHDWIQLRDTEGDG